MQGQNHKEPAAPKREYQVRGGPICTQGMQLAYRKSAACPGAAKLSWPHARFIQTLGR